MSDSLYNKTKGGVEEISNQYFHFAGKNSQLHFRSSKKVHQNKHGFLLVYAPWCGFCHDPAFVQSNELFQTRVAKRLNTFLVAFNADLPEHELILHELGVEGFPTMFHIKPNGSLQKYYGGRSIEERGLFILEQQKK
jgi:thiol:disulfide interchange protein